MSEQKIVMEFTEQQIHDLDAMCTEGYRQLRVGATEQQRAAALEIVHRIDANRHALQAGEPAPDAAPAAPRVYFPGDTVPAGVALMSFVKTIQGSILALSEPDSVDRTLTNWVGTAIEITLPTREQWQSTVDRAQAARKGDGQ